MAETHDTTAAKLAWLQELSDQAATAGSEKAVARQQLALLPLALDRLLGPGVEGLVAQLLELVELPVRRFVGLCHGEGA